MTHVVAGDGTAPALVASVALAPLITLLGASRPADRALRPRGVADAALAVALLLVLAANFVVIADLARVVGFGRWSVVALGPAVALGVVLLRVIDPLWRCAIPLGVALVVAPLVVVGVAKGGPWGAWTSVAARPALTFDERSLWVTDARMVSERSTMAFDETHRVIAGAPTTLRVLERDGGRPALREWRLSAGDALTLRPGDELTLEAGTPVRFEAGRRIPGAPASGAVWANGSSRPSPVSIVGQAFTLVVGAVALVPVTVRPVMGVPAMAAAGLLGTFVLGAVLWGLYGIALTPEVLLPPNRVVSLPELGALFQIPGTDDVLPMLLAAAVVTSLVGAVVAWRTRFFQAAAGVALAFGRPLPSRFVVTASAITAVLVAGALAMRGGDPWQLFITGLGLAGAAAAAPRLARASVGGEAAGAIVGTITFVVVLLAGRHLLPAFAGIEEYPALAAAPLAWLVARAFR